MGDDPVQQATHDTTEAPHAEQTAPGAALAQTPEMMALLLSEIIWLLPAAVAIFDREMRCLAVSKRWLTEHHLIGRNVVGLSYSEVVPDLPERWREAYRRSLAGETVRSEEDRWVRADGSVEWVRWETQSWRDANGAIGGIIVLVEWITGLKRTEQHLKARIRQQAAVAGLGQRALASVDLPAILDDAVNLVARTLGVEFVKVLEVQPGGQRMLVRAGVGWKEGVVGRATVEIGPDSQVGYTLFSKRPVIVEDIREEKRFKGLALLHEHGVVSGLSVVIQGKGAPYGVLSAHSSRQHVFNQDDAHFLQAVANVLAAAIDRQRAEDALSRAEERLQTVVANAPIIVFALDRRGNFTFAEGRGLEALGLKSEDVIGHSVFDVSRGETEVRRVMGRVLAGEEFSETIDLGGWGSVWETHYVPLRDERGELAGATGVAINVTERKRAEQELQRLLAHERALSRIGQELVSSLEMRRVADVVIEQSIEALDADAAALFIADPVRRELRLLASRNLLPASVGSIRVVPYETSRLISAAVQAGRVQATEDVLLDPEVPALTREFAEQEGVRGMLAVPLLRHGELVGAISLMTRAVRHFSASEIEFNATAAGLFAVALENARLYGETTQALRLREEFMTAAAHELKTPIATIKGWTGLLLRSTRRGQPEWRSAEVISRQTRRIAHVVDDLISVAQLHRAAPALKREPIDLATLVREVAERMAEEAGRHDLMIDADAGCVVDADRQLIREVVYHLIENGLRYSPAREPVEIAVRRGEREVVVSVTSHGPAIPPERQPFVFEPFYETLPSGAPGYVGMVSLGLNLSRSVVEAHGGRIWLASSTPEGTTFSFSLPLAA